MITSWYMVHGPDVLQKGDLLIVGRFGWWEIAYKSNEWLLARILKLS
jgi:hypothetical protein